MKIVSTKNAPEAIGPYSQAIVQNGMVYTSGQIALKSDGSFLDDGKEEQTKLVLQNLEAVLEAAGSEMEKVIKTTIFLTDMDNFAVVNAVYGEAFAGHKPARSTVGVKKLPKNAMVEIEAIAFI